MSISFNSDTAAISRRQPRNTEKAGIQKPVWNPYKVYNYVEDMGTGFQEYKKKATNYYAAEIAASDSSGSITTDELKKQIKELFPDYTLTDREPKLTKGKYYLYIDDAQLKKMADDPAYRARVYGLMDSELQGKKGYTLKYSDGRNITQHLIGTVFSLTERNGRGIGDIPYLGSCMSDHPISSSTSHAQFRSKDYISDNLTPERQRANTKKGNAADLEEKRIRELMEDIKERVRKLRDDYHASLESGADMSEWYEDAEHFDIKG